MKLPIHKLGCKFLEKKQSNTFIKTLLTVSLILASLAGNSQAVNHPQSFDGYGWGEKDASNIILSVGKYSESYIVNYNLSNGNWTHLNDSNSERLNSFVMLGDTGFAKNGLGILFYTTNNWKNILPSPVPYQNITKTETGLIGGKSISSSGSEYYHSSDGVNWTKVNTSVKGPVASKGGKTWLIGRPNNFYVSYDGGLNFIQKQNNLAPSTQFIDFIPFDSLNAIGIVATNTWYFTKDGGDNWAQLGLPSSANFIHANNFDTVYAKFTNDLKMTVDTGKTWQIVSVNMPENTPARLYKVGNYFVSQISAGGHFGTYKSDGFDRPWTLLHAPVTREDYNDVNFKGNTGLIVGNDGLYGYSHNKGKTYITGAAALGTQDLKACEVFNDSLLLIGDRQSNIYVSNDAGLTWSKRFSNNQNWISRKFRASADLSTIVLFRNGQNVLSTDKGVNWSILGNLGGSFDGSVTPSGKILIASGSNILEMDKSNGSTSTIKSFTEPNVQGVILEMIDDNNGYVIAINSTDSKTHIFRTTDAWSTYSETGTINSVLTIAPNPLVPAFPYTMNLSLNIKAPDTLYINRFNTSNASASLNVYYKSFDGGVTWLTDSIIPAKRGGTTDRMQGMHFFSGSIFVSVWEDGRIIQNQAPSTGSNGGGGSNGVELLQTKKNTNSVLVFPNPASDRINLKAAAEIEEIYLLDLSGKLIFTEKVGNPIHQLKTSDLPNGVYFLKIKTNSIIETRKIVIQN